MATQAAPTLFASDLQRQLPAVRAEAERLTAGEFAAWADHQAFHGEWTVFPLVAGNWPLPAGCNPARHQRRCPSTSALLAAHGVAAAAFFRMAPGCHVLPGLLPAATGTLRAHLGLRGPPGACLRVGAQWLSFGEGVLSVFRSDQPHEFIHLGRVSRLSLLLDLATT
jgi:aspartyl/asparaginyl beta-hydroxylase (cupin superfamily)